MTVNQHGGACVGQQVPRCDSQHVGRQVPRCDSQHVSGGGRCSLQVQRSTTQPHSGAHSGCGGRGGPRGVSGGHGSRGVSGGHGSRGPCRYGAGCANDNCLFIHHQNGRPGQRPCMFGVDCAEHQCVFAHPCKYDTRCINRYLKLDISL